MLDECKASCGVCERSDSDRDKHYFCRAKPGEFGFKKQDVSCFCEGWKQSGVCQKAEYSKFMKNYCIHSCDYPPNLPVSTLEFAKKFIDQHQHSIPDPPCIDENGKFINPDDAKEEQKDNKENDEKSYNLEDFIEDVFEIRDSLSNSTGDGKKDLEKFLKKVSELELTGLLNDLLEGQLDSVDKFNRSVEDVQEILESMIEMARDAPRPNVTSEDDTSDKEVVIDEDDTLNITDDLVEMAADKLGYNATEAPEMNCPEGWVEGNATCYKTIEVVGDFYQAAISCGSIGGALAVIDNPLEWAFVSSQLDPSCGYWLGASDRGHFGTWLNVDGTVYQGKWENNDTPKIDGKNCLAVVTDSKGVDKAEALDCYTKAVGAVCERRFLSDTQTCPYGWGLYGGVCMHVEAFRGNFQQARKYCSLMKGSDLAAPDDEGAWEFMLSMGAGEGFFLGISDIDDEGYWVTLLDNEVYTGPFGEGQPSSTHPLYDCGGIVSLPELAVGDVHCKKTGSGVVCGIPQYIDLSPLTMPPTTEAPPTTLFIDVETYPVAEKNVTEAPVITTTPEPEEPETHCPPGWVYWDFFCYKFVEHVVDFYAALRYCNDLGGNLVQPSGEKELNFMAENGAKAGYWLGVSDRGHEGFWRYLDGNLFNGIWGAGQPSNTGGLEDCMRLADLSGEGVLELDDYKCDEEGAGFVCKQLGNLLDNDITCGPDWRYYEGDCYYINVNNYTYIEAVEACEFIQSHLASPNDTEDMDQFVKWGASDDYWIGIHYEKETNWTTTINETYMGPLLYDGALGEMFHEEGRDCGAFVWMDDHFVVGDKECGHNGTGGICKQDKRPTDVFCKPGWYLYQGICYKLIDYQGTRSQMKQRCKQTGGRLATPKDYGVFALMMALGGGKGCWLGPSYVESRSSWWDEEGERYLGIWFPSQPDGGTNETCMIIHEHEGVLGVDDIHCDYQGTGAICEIGAEELLLGYTPLEKPIENNITKTDPYCPPEWSHYQGACYVAVEYEGDFYSAVSKCGDMGGYLVNMLNIAEKDFVIEVLNATDGYWVGATDEGHEGNWTTFDAGIYLGPWGPDQPDNGGVGKTEDGGQNCMMISLFEKLLAANDEYCQTMGKGFVCQQSVIQYVDEEDETLEKDEEKIGGDCQEGWIMDNGACYKTFKGEFNWFQARQKCETFSAKIASPANELDAGLFEDLMPDKGWLGSLDNFREGTWNTITGNEYEGPWGVQQPNGNGDCLAILEGQIADMDCFDVLPRVTCYKNPGEDDVSDEEVVCGEGQRYHEGYCYEIMAGNMKYADAQEACKKTCGGVIGYPSDESDLGFFASIGLNAGTWLGATDVATEAAWVTPDKTYYQGPFEKSESEDSLERNCLMTRKINSNMTCSDANCDSLARSVLCRCNAEDSPSCPVGWKLFNGMCYMARVGKWSWAQAEVMCKSERGTLAAPDSDKSLNFFVHIGAFGGSWLGATDIMAEGNPETTAGIPYAGPLDASEKDYGKTADCLSLQTGTGKFSAQNIPCHLVLEGAVCERLPDLPDDFSETLCLHGFTFYAGKCWRLEVGDMSFEDAKTSCEDAKSILGYPCNEESLAQMAMLGGSAGVWIGASDQVHEGQYSVSGGYYFGPVSGENTEDNDCLRFEDKNGTLAVAASECSSKGVGALCVRNPVAHPMCPVNWFWRKGGCFTAITDQMTAKEAEASCQVEKAHVAVAKDRDDLNFFAAIGATKRFWLGGSSAAGNGWTSMGGMPVNAELWKAGAPESTKCQMFSPGDERKKVPNAVIGEDCAAKDGAGTVCYRRAAPNVVNCETGWYLFNSTCYSLNSGTVSWKSAQGVCEAFNASLAVPNTPEEMEFIVNIGSGPGAWLGLTAQNGDWVDAEINATTPVIGSVLLLTPEEGQCVHLEYRDYSMQPDSSNCDDSGNGSVCEAPVADSEAQEWCEEGYTFYDGYCYQAFHAEVNFPQAMRFCEDKGAKVAFPNNEADFNFYLQIGADHGFWIGVTDLAEEGNFKTLDAKQYTGPWGEGQPNGVGTPGEDCVDIWTVDNGSPFVNDNPCDMVNKGVVCRKPPFQLISYDTLCKDGWTFWDDSCYVFVERQRNYKDAVKFCSFYSATVGYPNNDNDFAFMLQSGAIEGTWVGITDKHVDGVWATSDGSSYEAAWFVRDPKLDDEVNCAKIKEIDGKMYVVTSDCDVKGSAFFCKKSIVDYPMCPEGWSYDAGRCYAVFAGNWTWEEGKEECEVFGAGMGSPRNRRDLHYMISLGASQSFWLGARDVTQEGTWINVDGTAYEGPFADGRPNDLGNEDCMNLWDINGTLAPNDEECDKLGAGVVCAKPQRGHPKCFDGWYLYGGKCFTRVLGNFNYSQAVDACNSFGRNAIISAPEHYGELDFMLGMGAGDGTWIGANDIANDGSFITERKLRYGITNPDTDIHTQVFSFKQPDGGTAENCLILGKEAGSLGVFDRRCDHYGTGVVCEYIPIWSLKRVPEPTTTPAPTVTEVQNPCGSWDNHGESCYKLILKDDLDFHEALVECANENAYLVQVDSKGELEFLSTYSYLGDNFYVGAGDLKVDSVWQNIDGTPFNNKLWPIADELVLDMEWESNVDCVSVSFVGKEIYELVPKSCAGQANGVFCERPVNNARICPPYYVLFFGYCYKYYQRPATWLKAQHECTLEAEARLAVPTDDVELALIAFLSNNTNFTLLGSNDIEEEGLWVNDDNGDFNNKFWCNGEPDGSTGQNCLALMSVRENSSLTETVACGDDISCDYDQNSGYVCETNAVEYWENCPRGWTQKGDNCYHVFKGEFNWYKAIAVCSLYDSFLATVTESDDLVFFSMSLLFDEMDLTSAWLGASDMNEEGVWINVDNSPFPGDVWGPGQPEQLSPEADCLLYTDSELNDTNCLAIADSAICQRPTMNMNACPPNYARFFGSCFKKELIPSTYADAASNCEGQGTIIGTAHNAFEMEFLKYYIENVDNFALGAKCNDIKEKWETRDGREYPSDLWLPGEPDDCAGRCLQIGNVDVEGTLLYGPKDADCEEKANGFLCEIRAEDLKLSCPEGWQKFEDSCYRMLEAPMTWFESIKHCGQFRASPVVISYEDELKFLKTNSHFEGPQRLWTGCGDFKESKYVCIDETEFDQNLMGNQTSRKSKDEEDCLLVSKSKGATEFEVVDGKCLDNADGVICEKPVQVYEPPCPLNYSRFFGDCYAVYYENYGYKNAVTRCEDDESYLAAPINQFELQLMAALSASANILMGATDSGKSGEWVGHDGDPFPPSLWLPGQPKKNDGFDCMALDVTESRRHFGIMTRDCSEPSQGFICRQKTFKQPNVCPRGWHPGETSCYRAIPADIDFFGGISMCSFYKAIPAIINDDEEQQLLLTFGTDGYWLGTCDIVEERNFENIDGTEFNSLLFQDGEPDNMDGLQDCAILEIVGSGEDKKLHVGDTKCNERRKGVLCEKSKDMKGNSCPVGFMRWRQQCYKRVFAPATWEQAEKACQEIGSKLSVPDNEDEMIWIRALGEDTKGVWLGSTDRGHRGIWINADGSSYFGNWLPTQPDNKEGNERCMQLGMIDLAYGPQDRPCDEEGAGYICELNIDPDNKCPYGWRREKDSCYVNRDDEQEWSGAVVLCNYHNGAHPTFIDDIDELEFAGKYGLYNKWMGDSNSPNSFNKTSFEWRRSTGDEEPVQFPLKDDSEYDGGFECSYLKVNEKKEEKKAKHENWQLNDAVSEEKRQYDHVRVIEESSAASADEEGVKDAKADEDGDAVNPLEGAVSQALAEEGGVKRRRRAAGLLPQVFGGSHIELKNEMGEKKEYFIEFKGGSCTLKKVFQCELEIGEGNAECPLGWLHFENRCYKYYEENREWKEARKICQQTGADLAVLDSFQEQQVLKHLSLHNDNTWIGATDENHERLWINVDGSDYLMDWATSEEPDNGAISHGEQNCMALRDMELPESEAKKLVSDENSQETLKSYGSSDIACDAVSSPGFICEKPDNSTAFLKLCPTGWTKHGDECYRMFKFDMSFVEAAQYCAYYDSFLASIHDNETEHALAKHFVEGNETRIWVGVHDFGIPGDFVNMDDTPFGGEWARPDDVKLCNNETVHGLVPLAHCGTIHPNGLEFTNCTNKVDAFICQRSVDGPKCEEQHILFGGHCYFRKFVPEAPLGWHPASKECKLMAADSDLVSINTPAERDFVRLLGDKKQYIALGGEDEGHEGVWLNRDGTIFNNKLWQAGQPTECCGGQDCQGLWFDENDNTTTFNYIVDDLPCDAFYNGYICESPMKIGEVEGCQRGWTQFKDGCYRVVEDVEATFVNGIEQCAYNDATLASITDEESLSFLTGLLTNNHKQFFIGLSAWGINDTYINTRSSDLFIKDVESGKGLERCVKMSNDGKLLPTRCDSPTDGYICQLKIGEKLKCDASKITFQDQCYKYYEENLSWNVAKTRCMSEGATLMTINAPEEMWLAKELAPNKQGVVHVGIEYSTLFGTFSNMERSVFNPKFWSTESRDSKDKDKLCGSVKVNLDSDMGPLLEKVDCNGEIAIGYICEF